MCAYVTRIFCRSELHYCFRAWMPSDVYCKTQHIQSQRKGSFGISRWRLVRQQCKTAKSRKILAGGGFCACVRARSSVCVCVEGDSEEWEEIFPQNKGEVESPFIIHMFSRGLYSLDALWV